jgi:hypothetical protein
MDVSYLPTGVDDKFSVFAETENIVLIYRIEMELESQVYEFCYENIDLLESDVTFQVSNLLRQATFIQVIKPRVPTALQRLVFPMHTSPQLQGMLYPRTVYSIVGPKGADRRSTDYF